jgi:murein DD-endopeptidase MepM/ murein hydrolase activator NlpD
LKRAFLRKVKPVSCSPCLSCNEPEEPEQASAPEQVLSGAKRRARTSAAMVGLALSMGATGLLVPRQGDGASAAESQGPEVAPSSQVAALPTESSLSLLEAPTGVGSSTGTHTVRAGQTLRQVARQYQTTVEALAAVNHLNVTDVLKAGQVLKIPSSSEALKAETLKTSSSSASQLVALANLSSLPASDATASGSASQLRTERDQSLSRLQQQKEKLSNRLAELRRGDANVQRSVVSNVVERGNVAEQANKQAQTVAELPAESSQPSTVAHSPIATLPSPVASPKASPVTSPTANSLIAATPSPDLDWMRVNQSLVIPSTSATAPAQPTSPARLQPETSLTQVAATQVAANGQAEQDYQVNLGDTVAQIARLHNVTQSALISANRLSDPNIIFVGQTLRLPSAQQPARSVAGSTAQRTSVPSVLPASTAARTNAAVPGTESSPIASTVPSIMPGASSSMASRAVPVVPAQTRTQSLAVVPSSIAPQPASTLLPDQSPEAGEVETPSANGRNPYVQGLLSEVKALRDQRTQQASPTEQANVEQVGSVEQPPGRGQSRQPVALAASLDASQSAAELRGAGGSLTVERQAERQIGRQSGQTAVPRIPQRTLVREATPDVVAVAPLNPESYAPLTEQIPGRMVSPDLPALPDAEKFLPNGVLKGYIWPARGMLTSGYGWRWGRMHQGIDIAADVGTPIHAAAGGVVESAGWNSGGYGNMVEIRHSDGSMTRYAHMNAIYVQEGARVSQSEQIGEMGSTGYSTGPHLHFEVHLADQGTVNPMAYLPAQ